MQRRAFGRGDDIGRRARARGLGNLDLARRAERLGDARHGLARLGNSAVAEIAAGDGDAQAADAAPSSGVTGSAGARRCRPDRRRRAPASRRRRARDRSTLRANGPR